MKYNAISCDYYRQLFQERICTQLLSQMLEERRREERRDQKKTRGEEYVAGDGLEKRRRDGCNPCMQPKDLVMSGKPDTVCMGMNVISCVHA